MNKKLIARIQAEIRVKLQQQLKEFKAWLDQEVKKIRQDFKI